MAMASAIQPMPSSPEMVPFQPALTLSEYMGPARPTSAPPRMV